MTSDKLIRTFNKSFRPGCMVRVEMPQIIVGKLLTPACIRDEEPKCYVDGLVGPVPLRYVRPIGRGEGAE